MPAPSPLTYLPLFHRALASEIGIRFKPVGVERKTFINILYECRKQALVGDPRLSEIVIFSPAGGHETEVWMCNRQVELED